MGLFDKLGGNLIADRIRGEALKVIDRYVESAVINAVLPHQDGAEQKIRISAGLKTVLAETLVEYTEHMGKDTVKTLTIPLTEKELALDTVIAAKRPGVMAESAVIGAEDLKLDLSGRISGIGFRQMMMGVGATIDAVTFKVSVSGSASGTWLQTEEQNA